MCHRREAVDILQIPAFLCRQPICLLAPAIRQGVNVKKGPVFGPRGTLPNVVSRSESTATKRHLAHRTAAPLLGTTRWSPTCAQPCPNGADRIPCRDGLRRIRSAKPAAKRFERRTTRNLHSHGTPAVAIGVGAVFIETHEAPTMAPSDGPNMIYLIRCQPLSHRL